MGIQELYQLYKENYLVDTDTRIIRKNSIFFALKGPNFNGNKYAVEALKKGAKYAIVDEDITNKTANVILVDNVLTTLQNLANFHRKSLNIPIIALTGSNGKTTTKELIKAVISKKFKTTATKGNLNNHIGVPLTLLSMNKETEIGIVEMGANHHKEIALLSSIAAPDYGYITNFGKAHLEGFGSLEGVIKAKTELYDFLIQNNKEIFVNQDDTIQLEKTKNTNKTLFLEEIKFKEANPFVYINYENTLIKSNLIGNYNYSNIAAAITIGKKFNISNNLIKEAIEEYTPNNNRSQIIKTIKNQIILDAYNANPSSMKVAIENFNELKAAHKTLILGDMFELGDESLKEHQQVCDMVSNLNFNNIMLVGENFYKTNTAYLKFKSFNELKKHLQDNLLHNSFILIKGSRGMALEKLLKHID